MRLPSRILLAVFMILILSTTACSGKADPRDAEIERLNAREDQLIAVLNQQITDLKTEKAVLQETANDARYITHLETESTQMRSAISAIAVNSSSEVVRVLVDQNQELQNSLVKLTSQQNQIKGNLQGKLLDQWEDFGGYYPYPANIPDCDYWPFGLPTPREYNWSAVLWQDQDVIIGDF